MCGHHFWLTGYHVPPLQSGGITECLLSFLIDYLWFSLRVRVSDYTWRPMIAGLLYIIDKTLSQDQMHVPSGLFEK